MNLDRTPSANITDVLHEVIGDEYPNCDATTFSKQYSEYEKMAFDENIYPQGFKVWMDAFDADDVERPLSNLIRKMMRKNDIGTMYLTEED